MNSENKQPYNSMGVEQGFSRARILTDNDRTIFHYLSLSLNRDKKILHIIK